MSVMTRCVRDIAVTVPSIPSHIRRQCSSSRHAARLSRLRWLLPAAASWLWQWPKRGSGGRFWCLAAPPRRLRPAATTPTKSFKCKKSLFVNFTPIIGPLPLRFFERELFWVTFRLALLVFSSLQIFLYGKKYTGRWRNGKTSEWVVGLLWKDIVR